MAPCHVRVEGVERVVYKWSFAGGAVRVLDRVFHVVSDKSFQCILSASMRVVYLSSSI